MKIKLYIYIYRTIIFLIFNFKRNHLKFVLFDQTRKIKKMKIFMFEVSFIKLFKRSSVYVFLKFTNLIKISRY
jgi:hypothetical protein